MATADDENGRILGGTEKAWCRAVTSGTGNTVLGLKLSRSSSETSRLTKILSVLERSHPLLGRKLDYDPAGKTFRFAKPAANPPPEIAFHDGEKTRTLLNNPEKSEIPPLQQIVEREMRAGEIWSDPDSFPRGGVPLIFAAVYALSPSESVVVFRFHTSVCDRTTAVSFLSELLELVSTAEDSGRKPLKNSGEGEAALESLIPSGLTGKGIWTRGKDMLGYSLSALRMTNLEFVNLKMPRKSNLIRLHVNQRLTSDILHVRTPYLFI
ncbi:hypothetical protein M569_01543 [Genlisea aurea]|uniref:Uncharacterized protein n=1 Tax=Genlisea aurea TaxID=192259 RepID=S8D0B3_9LAMI|nr:hypothetical protein M569_01543 [Genlisea aurea]